MTQDVIQQVSQPARPFKIPVSVLVVVYTADYQALLIERANQQAQPTGLWQSVTGSLDYVGEPPEQAARREVMEETGIDCSQPGCALQNWQQCNTYALAPAWLHRYAPGVLHNTEHVWGLLVPRGTAVRLNPREHVAHHGCTAHRLQSSAFLPPMHRHCRSWRTTLGSCRALIYKHLSF